MRYNRRNPVVEAVQWVKGETEVEIGLLAVKDAGPHQQVVYDAGQIMIPTSTGVVVLTPGDWLVRHPTGRLEKMTDSVFTAVYEESE